MRRELHIGMTGRGKRLHLARLTDDGRGFSHCGRTMSETWKVGERPMAVDAPLCGSCVNDQMRGAIRWSELDHARARRGEGLFRVWADEVSPVGNDA
jgi:hypothetical protein